MAKNNFIITIMLTVGIISLSGQKSIDVALKNWETGEIDKAHKNVLQFVNESPENQKAKDLLMKTWFVQGNYKEALQIFNTMNKSYYKYKECVDLAIQAYLHLSDYDNALRIAEQNKVKQLEYLKEFENKRFRVIADQTYQVPFLHDDRIPSGYWPGLTGRINGIKSSIRLDTGGDYVVMGLPVAQKLGVEVKHKSKSMHAATEVTVWYSIIDSVSFDNGPLLLNVPVTIMASLGDFIIFGTNILEQFLTTIDYPNNQFIFTPRDSTELIEDHYKLLSDNKATVPFYLWKDHYMISRGKFGDNDSICLFFDSGLIAIGEVEGKPAQASFTASKESLVKWGFEKKNLANNCFIPTKYSLSVESLSQPNTLIWYDSNLKKDRNFGGIRIDGLISHAWLKNYSWTIDFDKMEYIFIL